MKVEIQKDIKCITITGEDVENYCIILVDEKDSKEDPQRYIFDPVIMNDSYNIA